MKLAKYLIPFLMVAGFTATSAYAQIGQETTFGRELNTRDDQPLREFVESKENIDVKEKASNLEISGDVRFEWRTIQEKGVVLVVNPRSSGYPVVDDDGAVIGDYPPVDIDYSGFHQHYRALRGDNHVDSRGLPISTNDFDVEFNIKFKYTYKDAWAMAHVQFDNPAGIRGRNDCFGTFPVFNKHGNEVEETLPRDSRFALKGSGEANFITLKRAYIGYNIWADGKHRLDIEVGRRKLDDVFDSEIEFTSRFDGVLLKYASAIDEVMDWYLDAAAFVIDERVNHFGYVFELGILNIYDTGLDIRYNFIDWIKRGRNRCFIFNPIGTKFQNSQITLTYTIKPTIYSKEIPFEFYGGFLVNHAARPSIFTHGKRKNLGWYAGLYIGSVHKKGDWSLDLEYIAVQAQAVPDGDVGSVGRGNILDENLFDILDESFYGSVDLDELYSIPSSNIIGYFPRRGNANFIGWRFEGLYAITDNLSLDVIYEFSNEEDRRIGGRHHYQDFEIEAVYAF